MNAARLHEVERVVGQALAEERILLPRSRAVIVGEDEGGLFAVVKRRSALEGHLRSEAWRTRRSPPTREERKALIEMADALATCKSGTPVLVVGRDGVTELLAWEGALPSTAKASACREAIRTLLAAGPMSGRVIREEISRYAENTVAHTITDMSAKGEIVPTGQKDGRSFVWRLADRRTA